MDLHEQTNKRSGGSLLGTWESTRRVRSHPLPWTSSCYPWWQAWVRGGQPWGCCCRWSGRDQTARFSGLLQIFHIVLWWISETLRMWESLCGRATLGVSLPFVPDRSSGQWLAWGPFRILPRRWVWYFGTLVKFSIVCSRDPLVSLIPGCCNVLA